MGTNEFIAGANLALKAAGVQDERLKQRLLQQAYQAQMLKAQREQGESDYKRSAMDEASKMIQGLTAPKPIDPDQPGLGYRTPQLEFSQLAGLLDPLMRAQSPLAGQIVTGMGALERGGTPEDKLRMAMELAQFKQSGDLNKALAVIAAKAGSGGSQSAPKPVNMPPWYDSMGIERLGARYHTPEGQAEFANFMLTEEGQRTASAYRSKYATENAVPFYLPKDTSEGIVSFSGRTGQMGQPSGMGKPIPSGTTEKIGDLNALLTDIGQVKRLYKYGTDNEEKAWVGPVAGRVGTLKEKYTGGAQDEQVKFYSFVRDMKDALLRARSGAQINEQEYQRLVKFLPDEYLPDKSFKARLERFEEQVNIVLESKKAALKAGGYGNMNGEQINNDPLGIR